MKAGTECIIATDAWSLTNAPAARNNAAWPNAS